VNLPLNTADAELAKIIGVDTPHSRVGSFIRWLLALGVLAALALGSYYYVQSQADSQAAPPYQTEPLTQGSLRVTVSATGKLAPVNEVAIGSELSGTIEAVFVDYNDRVKKGEVLARLNVAKLTDQIAKAKATLASAEAKVLQAVATVKETRANLGRLRQVAKLSGGKVPAPAELEAAEAKLERAIADEASARAAVEETRATLRTTETDLTKASIRSPIDGVVLTRSADPGQTVAASLQAPVLFKLAENLAQMELQVDVDEADVGQIKPEQAATFTVDAYPSRRYPARIDLVRYGAETVNNVVTYKTILKVNNDDLSLRPGMTATAEIVTAERGKRAAGPQRRAALHPAADGGRIETRRRAAGQPDAASAARDGGAAQRAGGIRQKRRPAPALGAARRSAGRGVSHRRQFRWPDDRSLRRGAGGRYTGHHRQPEQCKMSASAAAAPPAEPPPLIELQTVTKVYGEGQAAFQALRGVDLRIDQGDFVAVMGPSGSGKSTAMNILGCLDSPTAGAYRFRGMHVEQLSRNQRALLRRHYLGFVFQGFNLLARTTALENVELPLVYRGEARAIRHAKARAALDAVGLLRWEKHTPAELSGGQQQRVAIARAIVTDPTVLLADEPTGNLDSQRSHEIMDLLVALNRDRSITVLMVTHEPEMAHYAKRIIHFLDGRVDTDHRHREDT
jgi:RND family efflux transporter MFP subunit